MGTRRSVKSAFGAIAPVPSIARARSRSTGNSDVTERLECLRCRAKMEPGYLLDIAYGGKTAQEKWTAGAPEPSVWTGLKLRGKQQLPVTTYRCPKCGYLESYARPA